MLWVPMVRIAKKTPASSTPTGCSRPEQRHEDAGEAIVAGDAVLEPGMERAHLDDAGEAGQRAAGQEREARPRP